MLSVPLRFFTQEPCPRRGEPVTVGLPWPRGAVTDDRQFRLLGPNDAARVLQTSVLDRWPDGSVRWCLFDFHTDGEQDRIVVHEEPWLSAESDHIDHSILWAQQVLKYVVLTIASQTVPLTKDHVTEVEAGPVRRRVAFRMAATRGIVLFGHVEIYASSPVIRVALTIRNTNAADHPGGNWDLGNGGSVVIDRLALSLETTLNAAPSSYRISAERGQPFRHVGPAFAIRQQASGGKNWQSVNHINRDRAVPLQRNGYLFEAGATRTSVGDGPHREGEAPAEPHSAGSAGASPSQEESIGSGTPISGLRATPIVIAEGIDPELGIVMPEFWENFPVSISAGNGTAELAFFPGETELQGGEQKTFHFCVAFGNDTVTVEPLVWCRSPLVGHADPEWYARSGAIPYFTAKSHDPNAEYLKLVDQAIEGPDTFFAKREAIDEYGWRHFGDVYGDHEAVDWPGPEPMVSHYNNQYDCVAGFLYQFLRSGDPRWWSLAIPCANHTCDIDVYHTDGDKAAYNRGLFWHTYHYAPADTGTHRSYPKSLRAGPQGSLTKKMDQLGETAAKLKKAYAVGGGPAASHNYNAGLALAYYLTGNPLYRDTAIDLAKFVIAMEDPSKTPFRRLSKEFTGLATESGGGGYHGPGRASGNSVLALLAGFQLTGDRALIEKAEQIICRVSHPKQNLDRLDLLNAELRWFYTMFLQALGKYLDVKIELGELDRMYAYGRLTLLRYARWMAQHERPILDTPEKLQYPTETWAAQDMRKVEVFQYAAKHAAGAEREQYLERAEWFFRYVERKLAEFPTKSLCRPVVLMLNFGWSRTWWQTHPDATAPEPTVAVSADDFGEWRMFVPQKAIAMKRAKLVVAAGAVGFALLAATGIALLILNVR